MSLPPLCIDKASDQMYLVDRQGRIINANESAWRSLGYSREELLAMRFIDIDSLLTPKVWAKQWQELNANPSLRFETEYRKKDGR
jgi:PAS domain S-box-containing protein